MINPNNMDSHIFNNRTRYVSPFFEQYRPKVNIDWITSALHGMLQRTKDTTNTDECFKILVQSGRFSLQEIKSALCTMKTLKCKNELHKKNMLILATVVVNDFQYIV